MLGYLVALVGGALCVLAALTEVFVVLLVGTLLLGGAALGNLIGGDSRSTLIGAGAGAVAGGVVGNQQDRAQQGY